MSARRAIFIALWTVFLLARTTHAANPPKIVFLAGEFEYQSKKTLPIFSKDLEKKLLVETLVLERPDDEKQQTIAGLERLENADLLVVMVRRMTLPEEQLNRIKNYVESGRPIVGIRTASHAFENWKEFDKTVLGGNYQNHRGNQLKTTVRVVPEAAGHFILQGVKGWISEGSLYRNTPLQPGTVVLLNGTVSGFPTEPIAWTHAYKGARVFYTSLGHPKDFEEESFKRLLENAVIWALNRPGLERKDAKL